ncbi:MAG TPA: cytochrome c-type biogenesis protein CcmH [Candidatus Deferrimicrobium sp.]|nr:cytochrome c-type biogenesis protein CcmH [Candidatus Deferrimicrobium sp.]
MSYFKLSVVCVFLLLASSPLHAAATADIDDRTREIATELRCVVCQNLSVADSPSEMAQQMRAIVREQVQAGKTTDEIKDFFVSKYGEWVLLRPKTTGFSALLWILPYVALGIGVLAALWFIRGWTLKKRQADTLRAPSPVASQAQSDALRQDFPLPDIEDETQRAQLLRERCRLRDELNELEFDYQSGKLSDSDYGALKRDVETKGGLVMQQLTSLPAEAKVVPAKKKSQPPPQEPAAHSRFKRWQLITGGLFLMLFGLTLGVMLTQSIRPRQGEGDTMTGGFMTGTSPASGESGSALAEGKQAFERQEYPKAIEAFKKVLAADATNPEAHSYMGFILMQAGHGDGALMAFEKALSRAPNLPMALWGKGMVLYQDKKEFAGARAIFERLLAIVPPGDERNEIVKILAEIPASGGAATTAKPATAAASGQTISGTITIDAKLKSRLDPNAALFIIARPAGGPGGPPLAVKKIDKPTFPLSYSLSQENVMMQGTPFNGKINISVRLDKDGNPATRGAGDLAGEYKKNPAEVGAKNADVILDQVMQ